MSAVPHPCMQGGREVQKEERRRAAKECPSARLSVCALRSYGWWAGLHFCPAPHQALVPGWASQISNVWRQITETRVLRIFIWRSEPAHRIVPP